MSRGVGDEHSMFLSLISAPCVVKSYTIVDGLTEHGSVEGADEREVERGSFLQEGTYRRC